MVDELNLSYKCYIKNRSHLYFKTDKFFYLNDLDHFETRKEICSKWITHRSLQYLEKKT
jgi:hypothetical protein